MRCFGLALSYPIGRTFSRDKDLNKNGQIETRTWFNLAIPFHREDYFTSGFLFFCGPIAESVASFRL
jgi:hypothetical protein